MLPILSYIRAIRSSHVKLSTKHIEILAIIYLNPGITRARLGTTSTYDTTSISHALTDLKSLNLITETTAHTYTLSKLGLKFCARIMAEAQLIESKH